MPVISPLIHGLYKCIGIALLVAAPQPGASAATYYIDYVTGNDANSGTSKAASWQHLPGMQGCAASCSSNIPVPGNTYILKGGVTWPQSLTLDTNRQKGHLNSLCHEVFR